MSLTNHDEPKSQLIVSFCARCLRVLGQRFSTEEAGARIRAFDTDWHEIVTSYTLCKLTKHTDKPIAISSIAHELASTQILKKRYLAEL
jgi:hypothetical protein